jgi:hypothetical protein
MLRVNREWNKKRRAPLGAPTRGAPTPPAESRRILRELEQLHRIDGIWYHIGLSVLPEPAFRVAVKHGIATKVPVYETRWDVVRRAHISRIHGEHGPGNQPGNRALFNRVDVYAHTKRQLSKQELARYALKG